MKPQAVQRRRSMSPRGQARAAAAVGSGIVAEGTVSCCIGTSGVVFAASDRWRATANGELHAFCHAVPDTWHQMGVILSAAASLEWLAGILGSPAPKLIGGLGKTLAGPSPTLFLPYLSGERTPVADAQVRGLIMGLGHESDHKTLTHAALDAVAFAFRDSLEALKDAGTEVKRVTAVGGGSKSELWLKIIATVLGVPVDLPAAGDVGGAFGAARLGLIAATGADFRKVLTAPKTARTIKPEAFIKNI